MTTISVEHERVGLAPSQALVDDLRALTQQLIGWRLDELETDPAPEVRRQVWERLGALLAAARHLFERVLGLTLGAGEVQPLVAVTDDVDTFLEQLDRSVEEHSNSAAADIAFIAKLEIQGLEREVELGGRELDGWRLLELCERVRRHVVKATTALRRTLGSEHGSVLGKDEVYITELVRSIQVRRRYAIFRRQIMKAGETHPDHPWPRLRIVGTTIAVLICRPEYRDFRIGDRMLIRNIQQVLIEYLSDRGTPAQVGQRIWQDALGALEIMQQVNRRPELLEHDYIMLEALEARLAGLGPDDESADLLERAQSVFGRDEELDRLICDGSVDVARWRTAVRAARAALEQHRAPSDAQGEILAANEEASRSGLWRRSAALS